MLHKPDYVFRSVADIPSDFFVKEGIDALILDLDNTLTTHNNPVPDPKRLEWFKSVRDSGLRMIIVSNNHRERVVPFAEYLGLDFVFDGKKPLPKGYNEACRRLGIPKKRIAAVGDQIFTDILGCKAAGIRSIFVFPIEAETGFWFRVKRAIEKPLLPKIPENERSVLNERCFRSCGKLRSFLKGI